MKTLLIDDEDRSRTNLKTLIEDYCLGVEICGEASNAKDAIKAIKELEPDFVFLDIQMPGMNGLELASCIRDNSSNIPIVFVTAFDHYAIKAIKLGAIDYILKPVKISELQKIIGKVSDLLNVKSLTPNENYKISLPWESGFKIVDTRQILYLKADNSYSRIYFENGDTELFTKSIGELESLLCSSHFYRIHNTFLINLEFLDQFSNKDGGIVLMKNGNELPVSRRRLSGFKQLSKLHFSHIGVHAL